MLRLSYLLAFPALFSLDACGNIQLGDFGSKYDGTALSVTTSRVGNIASFQEKMLSEFKEGFAFLMH